VIGFKYRDKGTIVHRLNPFCVLAWVLSLFVLALIVDNPAYLALLLLSTLPVVAAGKLWRQWASFMKLALLLSVAIIVINALVSYHGSHVLVEAPFKIPVMGTPAITLEAIFYGAMMAVRLLTIVSAFAILTWTVHPDDMMLSMIKLRLPYKSVLVTSLSTRFVPTLIGDAERISDVQRSRGIELDRGNLIQRIKRRMAVVIPLLSNSLDRTVQVAEAMEARAFGSGTKRTFFRDIRISRTDFVTLVAALAPCALGIYFVARGHGDFQYYPVIGELNLCGLDWAIMAVLALLLASPVLLAFLKRRIELD
jgi:energy-coupling factor transport system permease protein